MPPLQTHNLTDSYTVPVLQAQCSKPQSPATESRALLPALHAPNLLNDVLRMSTVSPSPIRHSLQPWHPKAPDPMAPVLCPCTSIQLASFQHTQYHSCNIGYLLCTKPVMPYTVIL